MHELDGNTKNRNYLFIFIILSNEMNSIWDLMLRKMLYFAFFETDSRYSMISLFGSKEEEKKKRLIFIVQSWYITWKKLNVKFDNGN